MNNPNQKERRQFQRFPFNGEVRISNKIRVEPSDISEDGIYIITERSFMLGSEFEVFISFRDKAIHVKTRVQNKQEGIGMGLMFIDDDVQIKEKIRDFIEAVEIDVLKRSSKKQTILVIDDDVIFRKICRCKLTLEGFSVVESDGGVEVTELLGKEPISLIVLKLDIKKNYGFTLLGILKRSLQNKNIPLIVFSTAESQELAEKAKSAGANVYLTLSAITSAHLIKAVKQVLPL